ncbi:MAG: hypothetical protein CW716_11090 [Candidatus Bathyarchaeum sp.]|nr:MAG: hypothetical protein CW716_11090 [Candidatus Bathyarchaeum sp.]
MPTVTVLEKLYGSGAPETFEKQYSELIRGLQVQLRLVGATDRGWMQLEVSGEDETAALSLLEQEIGLAPASLDKLKKFSTVQGNVVFSNKSKKELYVDFGVFSPHVTDAAVSGKQLCAQLADGKDVPLPELVELFCLYDNVPLEVKIIEDIKEENKRVDAVLSEAQVSLFHKWIRSRFERLIVLGSRFSDVEEAVKFSRHSRDIIRVESLGVLEQVILCKLGTDAVGLIPKLGRYIKSSVLVPFSPKKILEAVGSHSLG